MCEASFAAISFVCRDRQWFKSEVGLGINQTLISQSFCAHTIQQPDTFAVSDTQEYPLFANNPLVTDTPKIRFYSGVAILAFDGMPIATHYVLDSTARPKGLTDLQCLALCVLAKQVEGPLELRRSTIQRDARAIEQQSTATALRWLATHDSLGHDAGDAVLRSFVGRLSDMVRTGDTVAPLGGDEFGIVLTSVRTKAHHAAIVGLGNSLGMETVAEGIETKQQAPFAPTCGCTLGQGYLSGAACPAAEIPHLVKTIGHHRNILPFQKIRPSVQSRRVGVRKTLDGTAAVYQRKPD